MLQLLKFLDAGHRGRGRAEGVRVFVQRTGRDARSHHRWKGQGNGHSGRFAGLVLPARESEVVEMEGRLVYADFTCQVKSA